MSDQTESCIGCGPTVPRIEGPTHRYMTAAPGCWARYGELSGTLAASPKLQSARQFTVDAYAAQHPGTPNPQAIQSVAVHLMSLYAYLERGQSVAAAPQLLQRAASAKGVYHWLTPPSFRCSRTVFDLPRPGAGPVVTAAAKEWAESVWGAWRAHHSQVAAWFAQYASR